MNNPRVFHVTSYGADPTGNSDSTEALFAAIADAAMQSNGLQKGHLLEAIKNLAGAQINLEGGNYMISRSLKFPAALGTSWLLRFDYSVLNSKTRLSLHGVDRPLN
ncbi:hypothetical protein TSUD_292400 [Trifolium subterraneum]|uniref:Pectate lyase superfamily protein domain-containing protein n=1 Tax=Trifolium subterraneum TaxID=3900 RepID=A0A2Z6N1F4_TRISU|nr:hypothetical protein TSUD_292400 [Trifolium subterraneum]